MNPITVPFNISILKVTKEMLDGMRPVTSMDLFDGNTGNLHDEGIYSQTIFGRTGEEIRDFRFSYIKLGAEIFHPLVYSVLIRLKGLYEGIIAGKEYANWNPNISDFEKATALDGQTGYHFFMKYWDKIKFQQTGSDIRAQMIELIEKYKAESLVDTVLISPAGIRDIEIDDNGRPEESDVNPLYRKLIAVKNVISESTMRTSPEIFNNSRYNLQLTFNQIYAHYENMIDGKKKLILGKWASRKIFNGTRNVASAMDTTCAKLGDPNNISVNNTVMGIYQYLKSIGEVAHYQIRSGFITKVFLSKDSPAILINAETLKPEHVMVPVKIFDMWTSSSGIEETINNFEIEAFRSKPIEIVINRKKYYLALTYRGKDDTVKLVQGIDEIPEDRMANGAVTPTTYAEFFYMAVFKKSEKHPVLITRYPITGTGSIYPSIVYLYTTTKFEVRNVLNDAWEIEPNMVARRFPSPDSPFVNTLVSHPSRNAGLNLDYDGDTTSGNTIITDEAIDEINDYMKTRRAYIGTDGQFMASVETDTVSFVLYNLSRMPG